MKEIIASTTEQRPVIQPRYSGSRCDGRKSINDRYMDIVTNINESALSKIFLFRDIGF